jgi:glycosylphosphatidylinositol transamidase (GPIT) subunit GPI8
MCIKEDMMDRVGKLSNTMTSPNILFLIRTCYKERYILRIVYASLTTIKVPVTTLTKLVEASLLQYLICCLVVR